ncbi:whirlin isoform X3 [Bradysia coprophila]|uniref:whirlin isoform X3 n=1 Tax=Bradysia coprophila TaxID=38358 RepID=UPI00187DBEFF|nr:whirlin isoform X3 [Bradysia coprophila]
MRLGGATSGVDPLVMGSGNDYAELSDLGPSRWSSRGYHPPHSSVHHPTSASSTHIRSNSFEAEDIVGPYGNTRIGNSTSSLRGRSGLYYSPPGTSYTIVERPHSPHYYYNTAGAPLKSGSLPGRGTYLGSSTHVPSGAGTVPSSTRHNGKKQPLSPEQVIRMFGTTTSSSSVPMSYRYSNGTRDRGRRSPASSPPSTTHQVYRERERDRSIPNISELTTRTVTMSRDQQDGHGFGICVKAGKEPGVGVYISRIEEGSMAERANLRPGDTILEVNGTPFTSINHDEALKRCVQILKSSRQISMTVRAPPSLNSGVPMQGFGPQISALRDSYTQPFRQTCSWMDRHGRPASPPMEYGGRRHERRDRIKRVELLIEPGQSLGLMIRGGVEYGLGIFITGVDKDSVADRAGLMIGDQILEVNSQSFLDVTHDEAVSQLKYHKRMSLLVRDVGKVPHSCTSIEPEPWDTYSPTGTRSRKKCPISAMVEEKARSLLPRHHFASLSYYITEYGARGMTIDAFVAVLLEMLDTSEKHSLVTEIRELVYPEDRTKYDELVYRRDTYLTDRDRHRVSFDRKGEHGHPHDLPVSEADLEVMVATSSAPTDDTGTSDIRHRPRAPLPYRPLSAGPVLHHHYASNRPLGGSHNDIPRTIVSPGKGGRFNKDYNCDDSRSRRGSETQLHRGDYDADQELATKLSRSFDMKEDSSNMLGDKSVRRHQSMQRLSTEPNGSTNEPNHEHNPNVVPDNKGNLHITVKKTKSILGIAIEGGANTKHPLPRIINIHEHGAAFETGGLEVGQLILEVDGNKVEGMHHQDVARLIAECFANRDKPDITFLVVEAKKSNLEPKPTALIFLEA